MQVETAIFILRITVYNNPDLWYKLTLDNTRKKIEIMLRMLRI